ncbi:TPA: hypothetical protein QCX05_003254 [Bacillus pacificus]|uniref:hypothetical protein n=1 Tax=Bacillus pacificus TaxID=2026187 RepID=UPI00065BEDC5|nr:hypothetical protein TU53_10030 [Bacillus cereus]HDR7248241.1 hypothetical protein [Bacillus pacificus]
MTDITVFLKDNKKQSLYTDMEEIELLQTLNSSRFIKLHYYDGGNWRVTLVNADEIVSVDF